MPDHLSASQITGYLSCSLHYYFRYVEQRTPEKLSAALAFGKAIHSTLATFHQSVKDGKPISPEEAMSIFRADWTAESSDPLMFTGNSDEEGLSETGQALVGEYVQTCDFEVVDCEKGFQVPLIGENGSNPSLPLHGIYDLLTPDGIVELKTAKNVIDHTLLQRHLPYAYELQTVRMPKITMVYMLKLKKPRIEKFSVVRNKRQIRFFLQCASNVARGIEEGIFAPNPNFLCQTCDYADACANWPE